ncbi:RagB/SusD family nutrient uptake outer membrane protein [Mucilaginibacter sp. PPCGB 2223]|uniref:RagB/SusD family nutrient uptake outer membrane protein n=1 Tax=Mucilaginibacter sp. PPCGB 2223 TaxID=1886027 RepID=UPI000A52CCA8|nr:RagB/SusD family nutrient uptake outer membrane protein [Mucilaginibacter sp. PPCGB 2223]
MKTKYLIIFSLFIVTFCVLTGCKKYLDAKPDTSLATISQVSDLQGFLDQHTWTNDVSAEEGEISADSYYVTDAVYATFNLQEARALYLWQTPTRAYEWDFEYSCVYSANIVLDNLPNLERNNTNASAWDNCKGSALLFRGKAFLDIALIWAKSYDSQNSNTDLGIPLRLTSDFNVLSKRASVQQTYDQILTDLKSSIPLLPRIPINVFRPSKGAAYGLLARTYLMMRKYDLAKLYADSCLQINSNLLDYNSIKTSGTFPFSAVTYTNPEHVLYLDSYPNYHVAFYTTATVDPTLYASYDVNDLRKSIFFIANPAGGFRFRGDYTGGNKHYNGIATDEMFLTRAECEARNGDTQSALNDLNTLLAKRYKAGTFVQVQSNNATALLQVILTERRKELFFRLLRFADIKRLNLEGANISITRVLNGQTYTLPANDERFALAIPADVITLSGIQQNPGH